MRTYSLVVTLALIAVAAPDRALAGGFVGKVCSNADLANCTPVANAQVRLSNGTSELSATTDSTGKYNFSNVASGTWCAQAWTGTIANANFKAGEPTLDTASKSRCRTVPATTDVWGSLQVVSAGRLLGKITNSVGGAVLSAAKITIKDGAGNVWLITTSDANGSFTARLPPGTYTATASKRDFSPNSVTRTVTANKDIWGSMALTPVAAADTTPPTLALSKPVAGEVPSSAVAVSGTVSDASSPVTVTVAVGAGTPTPVTVSAGAFSTSVTVPANPTTATAIKVTAKDPSDNVATKSVNVTFKTGFSGVVHKAGDTATKIAGATLTLKSGTTVKATASSGTTGGYRFDVAPGAYTLEVSKSGYANTNASLTVSETLRSTQDIAMPVSVSTAAIAITEPAAGAVFATSPITVKGTYTGFVPDSIQVNGVTATLNTTAGTFTASVDLLDGINSLAAVGSKAGAEDVTDGLDVVYEPAAPQVRITSPAQAAVLTTSSVTVTGTYSGFDGEPDSITVNETEATFSAGTFSASIDLYPGENFIVATAQKTGMEETITDSIDVTYEGPIEEQPDAGDGQLPGDGDGSGSTGDATGPVEIPSGACGCSTGMEPMALLGAFALPLALLRRRRGARTAE